MRARVRIVVATLIAVVGLIGPGASASQGLVGPLKLDVGDSDRDGLAEASVLGAAGGPCACRCPIIGGDWEVAVLGQTLALGIRSALGVCGTRLKAGVDPGPPDPRADPDVGSELEFNPNGLGRGGPAG
ncbi:MAG: hypothetical protein AB1679_33965 [Actinomycetota bacterium]|jgi:hypothetical protein